MEDDISEADWARAWAEELDRRDDEVENGTAVLYDWEEVSERIRASLRAQRQGRSFPPSE